MKNIKSILTLTLIGGSIILTGCSSNTKTSEQNSNSQLTTQVETASTNQVQTTSTNTNNEINYNVDMASLEKDLKALEEGKYNGKYEDELDLKYGENWDDAMEAKYGEDWDEQFEAKMDAKLNEGTTREDLIKSIEGELSEMLNRIDAPINWEDELEAKYGDDMDDLMEQKYGDNWDDQFEVELMK